MTYSDILLYTITSTEDINKTYAEVMKYKFATSISNESAVFYSLANEGLSDKVREYAGKVWKFIKDILNKIKTFILNAFKHVKEFFQKRVAAIRARFSKKDAGAPAEGQKPEEAKAEPAHEAAEDVVYYYGVAHPAIYDESIKVMNETAKEMEFGEVIAGMKDMNDEELKGIENYIALMKSSKYYDQTFRNANAMLSSVQKVPASQYPDLASKLIAGYTKLEDKCYQLIQHMLDGFEKGVQKASNMADYPEKNLAVAKTLCSTFTSFIAKYNGVRQYMINVMLELMPVSGFATPEAAKEKYEEVTNKIDEKVKAMLAD